MKKKLCILLSGITMLCLSACGAEEEVKNAASAAIEQDGVAMTMTFDAKGDTVTRITQESTMDISEYTEDQIAVLDEAAASAEEVYAALDGVEYSCEQTDGTFVEKIIIPTDEETLKAVVEQGILPVDNEELTELSLQSTLDNLESSGWTVEQK